MNGLRGTTEFRIEEPTAITFGKFDGVHRGHRLLLDALLQKKQAGLKTVVFTFDIPPRKQMGKDQGVVLTTNEEKMRLFENLGIDYCIECPFSDEIRNMRAEDFIHMIVGRLHVACMVVGTDFCFGHNRTGDYRLLQEYAGQLGYEVIVLDKIQEGGRDISSTDIREYIREGALEKAEELLGYPYFARGTVEHGNEIGRTIGFPTMNLFPGPEKLLPPFGVYITKILLGERKYFGITNVGRKPTIEGENPVSIETHVLDFSQDAYGRTMEVYFLRHIRPEAQFSSLEELRRQIAQDSEVAKAYALLHASMIRA